MTANNYENEGEKKVTGEMQRMYIAYRLLKLWLYLILRLISVCHKENEVYGWVKSCPLECASVWLTSPKDFELIQRVSKNISFTLYDIWVPLVCNVRKMPDICIYNDQLLVNELRKFTLSLVPLHHCYSRLNNICWTCDFCSVLLLFFIWKRKVNNKVELYIFSLRL
jgi:hypothetical protein